MVRISILLSLVGALVCAQTLATLSVTGDVATPLKLSADELAKMPRETASVDGPNGKVQYEGVALREVLARAGAPMGKQLRGKALASYVIAKARDGYQVVFSVGEIDAAFGNAQVIIADRRDAKPLPENQGPLRLVCPNDHEGARSVRMLESLELVRLQK
ncbi:MAG TPA: molybdopterin-dependent oxidoreductase [Bryobacteraceae bacterium]|nr:molybdopterin-dependent oxidoreductase [Bryobacteraceae bacterium]